MRVCDFRHLVGVFSCVQHYCWWFPFYYFTSWFFLFLFFCYVCSSKMYFFLWAFGNEWIRVDGVVLLLIFVQWLMYVWFNVCATRVHTQPENCLTSYEHIHGYCVIYSSADRDSFILAERVLQSLWTSENIAQKAVILVGNKADLARSRTVTTEGKCVLYTTTVWPSECVCTKCWCHTRYE